MRWEFTGDIFCASHAVPSHPSCQKNYMVQIYYANATNIWIENLLRLLDHPPCLQYSMLSFFLPNVLGQFQTFTKPGIVDIIFHSDRCKHRKSEGNKGVLCFLSRLHLVTSLETLRSSWGKDLCLASIIQWPYRERWLWVKATIQRKNHGFSVMLSLLEAMRTYIQGAPLPQLAFARDQWSRRAEPCLALICSHKKYNHKRNFEPPTMIDDFYGDWYDHSLHGHLSTQRMRYHLPLSGLKLGLSEDSIRRPTNWATWNDDQLLNRQKVWRLLWRLRWSLVFQVITLMTLKETCIETIFVRCFRPLRATQLIIYQELGMYWHGGGRWDTQRWRHAVLDHCSN